jgi:DNA-binding response OmpR family regulator
MVQKHAGKQAKGMVPRGRRQVSSAGGDAAPPTRRPGELPRVLVVDHDAARLAQIGHLLKDVPADAIPVTTCEAARYAAATLHGFDVVIAHAAFDDGGCAAIPLAGELRAAHGCRTIIVSTADPPKEGTPPGVDVWMVEPLRLEALRRAIRSPGR